VNEIEKASPVDLALSPGQTWPKLAAHRSPDKLAWEEEMSEDFSADGKHADALKNNRTHTK